MKTYLLETENGYATDIFESENWMTTEIREDAATEDAPDAETAIDQFCARFGVTIRHRKQAGTITDSGLHQFSAIENNTPLATTREDVAKVIEMMNSGLDGLIDLVRTGKAQNSVVGPEITKITNAKLALLDILHAEK